MNPDGLPVSVENVFIRSGLGDLSLEALAQIPDEALLWLRGFGGKSLRMFREKIAEHLPGE